MSKRSVSFFEFEQVTQELSGQQVWRSRAGSGTGSIFTMEFRPTLKTDKPQSEFSLMVYCAWRIVEAGRIICTWHEDADNNIAPALKTLEGTPVTKAILTEWGDLTIDFLNGRSLHVWNDAPFKDGDSWFVGYSGLGYYSVSTRNAFFYELEDY
ncbi:hypothetical protein GCM10022409_03490 [Hymenobacter glaciei]|uniref:Beta-xylosidase C-terminal Concanavalin A-like domain-containing protein n=1 Tax=Hymenobacter glaciei TaxID=877209 RepID=A0ABP7TB65_9BACT